MKSNEDKELNKRSENEKIIHNAANSDYKYGFVTDIDMQAEEFNQGIIALSFFPSGANEKKNTTVSLDNKKIILSRFSKEGGAVKIRLYNASASAENAELKILDNSFAISFGAYEVKTFVYSNGTLTETDMI